MTSLRPRILFIIPLCLILLGSLESYCQGNLYTARGYWEETTKANYRTLKQKLEKGDSLSVNEKNYLKDYEVYLRSYFDKMSQDDRDDYIRLKANWDKELESAKISARTETEFEWRTRDRFANALYGLWYGSSLVVVTNISGAAAAGIPLITSGLWVLGPAINPKKYENITRATVRANNTGKLLGLGYGAALGWALAGNSENSGKWAFGLSTFGSILLGEVAFHEQIRKNYSAGHVEMMRHYGWLGPWIAIATVTGAGSTSSNVAGLSLLAGGVGGLVIGNKVANRYDYSKGDADVVGSMTLLSTGLGFAVVGEVLKTNSDKKSVLYIPAAASILGTVLTQRAVHGVHLTDKQGSTINLSAAGAALIGVGIMSMTKSESATTWIAVPTGLAFITHQVLFHKYKMKNLETNIRGSNDVKRKYNVSLKVTPENYFLNQQIPTKNLSPQLAADLQNPLVKLVVKF